jgi:chitin disaccharide deacetylase
MKVFIIIFSVLVVIGGLSYWAFRDMFVVHPPEVDPEMKRYLIINADDLCLSSEIDRGIAEAYQQGVVTSTTAMINMPGAPEALKTVHELNPDLPIGLHINITTGRPVLDPVQVPSLVDDAGKFFDVDNIPLQLLDISLDELRAEVNAQVELFMETGVPLSHLDYHHNIMALYTQFFDIVRDIALKHNLPVRNPAPISVYGMIELENGAADASMRMMMAMGLRSPVTGFRLMKEINPGAFRGNHDVLLENGIPTTHWFIDSFYNNATVDNFISILEQLPPGVSEIMVHPGQANLAEDDYQGRILELDVLTSPEVKAKIEQLSITLVDFSALNK